MANYEPMMMGSPVSSPSSPGAHGAQSPFLPGFLMGDQAPAASPVQSNSRLFSGQGSSPSKSTPIFGKNAAFSSPFMSSAGPAPSSEPRRDVLTARPKDKPGAPPVTGLLETLASPTGPPDRWADVSLNNTGRIGQMNGTFSGTPTVPSHGVSNMMVTPNRTGDASQIYNQARKTPPSPAQVDPFYTQGESIRPDDDLDETWVTIFGFPPAATSFILQQFSQYGNIIKHIVATDGNWMHVHYQSKLQAKKALSKNSKVFGGTIMVGVTPCIDKSVMEQAQDLVPCDHESVVKSSYLGMNSTHRLNQSVCDRSMNSSISHNTSIRPLTAAYKAANSEHEVVQSSRTPQKNSGIIGKTMEYVFGW